MRVELFSNVFLAASLRSNGSFIQKTVGRAILKHETGRILSRLSRYFLYLAVIVWHSSALEGVGFLNICLPADNSSYSIMNEVNPVRYKPTKRPISIVTLAQLLTVIPTFVEVSLVLTRDNDYFKHEATRYVESFLLICD